MYNVYIYSFIRDKKVSDRIGVRNKQNAYIKDHTVKQQVCWEGLMHDKS